MVLEVLKVLTGGCLGCEDAGGQVGVDYDLGHSQDLEGLGSQLRLGPQQEAALGVDQELVLVGTRAENVQVEVTSGEGVCP